MLEVQAATMTVMLATISMAPTMAAETLTETMMIISEVMNEVRPLNR